MDDLVQLEYWIPLFWTEQDMQDDAGERVIQHCSENGLSYDEDILEWEVSDIRPDFY